MTIPTTTTDRENFEPVLCPLTDMGVIEVTGADAEAFLNAQLSRNVHSHQPSRATLAAWLDARGRVLALFRVLRVGDGWLLLARGADVEALIRRLSLFVLRADVRLRNLSSRWLAAAAVGGTEPWLESRSVALGSQTGSSATVNGAFLVRVGPRLVYLVSAGEAPGIWRLEFRRVGKNPRHWRKFAWDWSTWFPNSPAATPPTCSISIAWGPWSSTRDAIPVRKSSRAHTEPGRREAPVVSIKRSS